MTEFANFPESEMTFIILKPFALIFFCGTVGS